VTGSDLAQLKIANNINILAKNPKILLFNEFFVK